MLGFWCWLYQESTVHKIEYQDNNVLGSGLIEWE